VSDQLYTLNEAAQRLSISLRTLRRRIDLGLIRAVRLGVRSPRVSESEIRRVIRDGVSAE
jgi:excisionase family DNA binding protein